MRIKLGAVGHFGLAVRDPKKSARWWRKIFDLETIFEDERYIGLSNDNVTIVLNKGVPRPATIQHMSFNLRSMRELRAALTLLKRARVAVEDPGDEIGPQAPGSPYCGLWFEDPDGYRWELSAIGR
jgi:catechol 2,3-dioxygenase-like lactoylglutathione lyase family enzyme